MEIKDEEGKEEEEEEGMEADELFYQRLLQIAKTVY